MEDHRWTGTEGREAYLRTVMALWELAPDSRFEAGWFWLARAPRGSACTCRRSGALPDGGEFVSDFLVVTALERGLAKRVEVFEVDAADAALARFAQLHPDPLRLPPNAVTRTWDRWCAAAAARAWDTLAALHHPSHRSEDRRRLIRLTTDRAGMLENERSLAEGGWRPAADVRARSAGRSSSSTPGSTRPGRTAHGYLALAAGLAHRTVQHRDASCPTSSSPRTSPAPSGAASRSTS